MLHIGEGAIEVALKDDADVFTISRIESLLEKIESPLGVLTRLHVDPYERSVLASALENLVHDGDAKILRDIQPHRRELDRDVGVCLSLVDAVEQLHILVSRRASLLFVVHALAEQVERRRDVAAVQSGNSGERGIECLAGDEPIGKALGDSIVAHELEYLRLVRQVEQCATKHLVLRKR